jgi:hypothetical protein
VVQPEKIAGLDGDRRQELAAGLWRAWWEEGRSAAVLTGFSGLGKTEKVVRPLVARAIRAGRTAIVIDVPVSPMDLDKQLTALLVDELNLSGATALADEVAKQPSFSVALRQLLRQDVLVVLDEFQRLLGISSRPSEPLATNLQRISARPLDRGCLWLVSSRAVDSTWTEPFHVAVLEAPSDLNDLQHIVLTSVGTADAEERFPRNRRLEVVRRLGANPRALRLLGNLLQYYPLEELLGPPGDVPQAPADPQFAERIERSLLAKAEEGLSNAARVLLRELTVLREPAQWELVEAISGHLGDVRTISRELRERYLLDVSFNRYRLHPLVREVDAPRLRRDEVAWQAAHKSAGNWYARLLHAAERTSVDDAKLAIHLAGARYHLIEAQSPGELREAMLGVKNYVERSYGWTARNPTNSAERDAQISLLGLYLSELGPASVEYHFAKLLKARGTPSDLLNALPHARQATIGQDHAQPWVQLMQIVREVEGLESAAVVGRTATECVVPKDIFGVYQLLAACLGHVGKVEEAVEVLMKGVAFAHSGKGRLVEEALLLSAAEHGMDLLQRVRDWSDSLGAFATVVLGDILLLEYKGEWSSAAETAHRSRALYPAAIHLAKHEALCWLGASLPEKAQEALDRFPVPWRREPRDSVMWLASLVALHCGDAPRASELLAVYLGMSAPAVGTEIRAMLLLEWDQRVATVGEPNPALQFPILPPAVTGLDKNVRRPQYGLPVLRQTQVQPVRQEARRRDRLGILAIGDEWRSGRGGLSTLNRQLCRALAAAGTRVMCLVLQSSPDERQDAGEVTLIEATRTPGQPEREALSRKPHLPEGFTPDVIIGHGRVTGPAAQILAEDHFPRAKRLHFVHMAPDEIEWFKLDRDDDAGARAEERTQIELDLGRSAARVVAVGPRLYNRYLTELHPYGVAKPLRLDPGFEAKGADARDPPPGSPWRVLLVGRLEDDRPKGLDLAAKAVGLAAERRGPQATPLELIVRGARPDTSADLRDKLREWSGYAALSVVARPFTAETESLDADIKRASLVLMPSRKEGFGLVGLEAIVAGAPTLVSSESGLGELLRETLEQQQAGRIVVQMSGDDTRDREEWARAVEATLRDRDAAFRRAAEVRTLLANTKSWTGAIALLLAELR